MTTKQRLHYTLSVNWVHPEDVVAYRGSIVLYAYQWDDEHRIMTAENHIVEIDDGSAHPQMLVNVDPGSASFCWGYGGSGPSALALSLLAHHLGEHPAKSAPYRGLPTAHLMHGDLVRDLVSRWSMDEGWVLPAGKLASWVRRWQLQNGEKLARRAQYVAEQIAFEREMDALALEEEGSET